jgi:hypothetical protein
VNISADLKKLLRKLLTPSVDKRVDLKDLIDDEWLSDGAMAD